MPSPSMHCTDPRADMVKESLIPEAGNGKRIPRPTSIVVEFDRVGAPDYREFRHHGDPHREP